MKTSLKKCIRADSNFTHPYSTLSICQMLANFSGVESTSAFPEGAAGRLWGCEVVDFKNGLPGADSVLFHTVTTHQPFF